MDDLETKSTSRQQSIPESQLNKSRRRFTICIVSDFFLPRLGGVELHQFEIAQRLIKRGHRVIVVTGTYGNNRERQGIRYLAGNLKVYYCPQIAFHNQVSVPTLFSFLPLFRNVRSMGSNKDSRPSALIIIRTLSLFPSFLVC